MRSLVAAAVLALAGAAAAAPGDIQPAALLEHIKFLSSDELQGRGDGSPELERAAEYVAAQFRGAGLRPGGEGGTWFQGFELVAGLTIGERNELSFGFGGRTARFTLGTSYYPLAAPASDSDTDAIGDARGSAARLRRLRAGGALDRLRRLPARGRGRQGGRDLQSRTAGAAVGERHERRPAGDGVDARGEGRRGALPRRKGAHRHRRPHSPDRSGGLHPFLQGPRRRRPPDPGAPGPPPRGAAARRSRISSTAWPASSTRTWYRARWR